MLCPGVSPAPKSTFQLPLHQHFSRQGCPWPPVQPPDRQTPRPIPGPSHGNLGILVTLENSLVSWLPCPLYSPTLPTLLTLLCLFHFLSHVATVQNSNFSWALFSPTTSQKTSPIWALSTNTSLQVMETLASDSKHLLRSKPTIQAVQG